MRVQGHRRCKRCDHTWSYYDTGDVACPDCGSLQSVSTDDERTIHTDAPIELDLAEPRTKVGSRPLREVADLAQSAALEFFTTRGFVHDGTLQPLDDTVVAASQLRHVAARITRATEPPGDPVEAHFLALLRNAPDGSRPDSVPAELRGAYGLATADAVDKYRSDVSTWLKDASNPPRDAPLDRLRDEQKRIEALEGDVPPSEADGLLAATRSIGRYLRTGDDSALAGAEDLLDTVE